MIKTFRHKGIESFFRLGSKAGKQPHHAAKLRIMLTLLDSVKRPEDMSVPGWRFPPLLGTLAHHYSVSVSGNWRMTFAFEEADVVLVDDQDDH